MDCYLIHKKYRNKNDLNKPYQESKLLFVFKNFKFKGCLKQQIIIFKITMLFLSSKLVILTNKNRLIKLIKTNHYKCSLSYLTFSEFDTFLSSRLENIIKLKNIKINIKEEDLSFMFENIILKKGKIKIDNVNKEIYITDLPNYDNLKNLKKGGFNHYIISPWLMENYEKYYTVRPSDIIKIDTI